MSKNKYDEEVHYIRIGSLLLLTHSRSVTHMTKPQEWQALFSNGHLDAEPHSFADQCTRRMTKVHQFNVRPLSQPFNSKS